MKTPSHLDTSECPTADIRVGESGTFALPSPHVCARLPLVLTTIRQTMHLLGHERRGRWLLLALLALVISGVEMVGALLVYTLLALVVDPSGSIELPAVGELRSLAGGVDDQTLLLTVVLAMAAFFLLRGVIKVGVTYLQARVAHNAGARLSNRLVRGYLSWPYAAHLQRNSSELIRNAHQAVQELIGSVILPSIRVVAEMVLILGMLVVLVAIAPAATALAVLVIGSAAVLLVLVIQPRLKRIGQAYHQAAGASLASLQQSLHGLRDVKLLGREEYFAKRYGRSRLRMARSRYLAATAAQLPTIVIETALIGFILLFFGLAITRGGAAQETLSVLGLFGYVGLRLQPSLQQIIQGLNSLKYAAAPLEDLHADLVAVEALQLPSRNVEPLPFEQGLVLDHVSFRYEGADREAVRDIDLVIRPGQQIGICGPTGGGKTTLVDLMTGLLEPTAGQIRVDGHDLRDHARAWQAALGVVPQMVFLVDDSLRRNIALGVPDGEIDEADLGQAIELAQLDEFVGSLPQGLETQVGERGIRVSGGQRQRIAIARALYRQPAVLVFDEGTSALDNATEAKLMEAIERLRGRHTIVLIAHRLSTVRAADQVIFVEDGRLAGHGTYEELLTRNPSFRMMAASS